MNFLVWFKKTKHHKPSSSIYDLFISTKTERSQIVENFVTQAGKVGDVTLQRSRHAEDESVIKVSAAPPFALLPFVVVRDDEFLIFFWRVVIWLVSGGFAFIFWIEIIGFYL